jgi:hypothetical protein
MSDCVVIALITLIQVFLSWRHVLAIVKLTGDTGAQIELETEAVVRIRRMADSERDFHEAATRIDYAFTVYAKEEPDVVVKAVTTVQGGLTTLGKLTLPNAWPVWFNGKEAEGPFPIPASMKKDGIQSALTIGGKIQYVRNGPQEVRDVIAANQGKVLPLPPEAMRSAREANKVESSIASKGVWDADVPELQVPSLTQ